MVCLALEPEQRLAANTLAERTQAPMDYLSKVLQALSAAGLIEGRRGVGGGYRLTKAPTKIRMLDVVQAVGTVERIKSCPLGLKSHGTNLCPLHREMDRVIAVTIDALNGTTLAELVNQPGANNPLCDTTSVSVSAKRSS
jgi:Rrf2 family protein